MRANKYLYIFLTLIFSVLLSFSLTVDSKAGDPEEVLDASESDTSGDTLIYFFDLRDRETYIQLTYTNNDGDPDDFFDLTVDTRMHIQIFDISNNCNENDFFDVYTPNDTHVYNMRNIETNDGNPSGVNLPNGAYGFVFAYAVEPDGSLDSSADVLIGNLRILDNNGYEYRTNSLSEPNNTNEILERANTAYFNFNTEGGVSWSDVIGIAFDDDEGDIREVSVSPLDNYVVLDVDIYDLNEVPFSCRDIIYSCITAESSLYQAVLDDAAGTGSANVAAAEYGINNAIPNTHGGELLCPGNIISDGFTTLNVLGRSENIETQLVMYVGLNNGNARGSMDSFWYQNCSEPLCGTMME